MEGYNCPNCGAPIGYMDKCDYCGTRIEWRPYVIHLGDAVFLWASISYADKNER